MINSKNTFHTNHFFPLNYLLEGDGKRRKKNDLHP